MEYGSVAVAAVSCSPSPPDGAVLEVGLSEEFEASVRVGDAGEGDMTESVGTAEGEGERPNAWRRPAVDGSPVGSVMGAKSWPPLAVNHADAAHSCGSSSEAAPTPPPPPPLGPPRRPVQGPVHAPRSNSYSGGNRPHRHSHMHYKQGSKRNYAANGVPPFVPPMHYPPHMQPVYPMPMNPQHAPVQDYPFPAEPAQMIPSEAHFVRPGYDMAVRPFNRPPAGMSVDTYRNFQAPIRGDPNVYTGNFENRRNTSQEPIGRYNPPWHQQRAFIASNVPPHVGPPLFPGQHPPFYGPPQAFINGPPPAPMFHAAPTPYQHTSVPYYPPPPPPPLPVPPPPPLPASEVVPQSSDQQDLRSRIVKQIEYYFSAENLCKDRFMRCKIDQEGWIPISIIAGFRRVLSMTEDIGLVIDALKDSNEVELRENMIRKSKDWDKFLGPLPDDGLLPSSHAAQSHITIPTSNGVRDELLEAVKELAEHHETSDRVDDGTSAKAEGVAETHHEAPNNVNNQLVELQHETAENEEESRGVLSQHACEKSEKDMSTDVQKASAMMHDKSNVEVGNGTVLSNFSECSKVPGRYPVSRGFCEAPVCSSTITSFLGRSEIVVNDAIIDGPSMYKGDQSTFLLDEELELEPTSRRDHLSSSRR